VPARNILCLQETASSADDAFHYFLNIFSLASSNAPISLEASPGTPGEKLGSPNAPMSPIQSGF
jgi:hypothetical protein